MGESRICSLIQYTPSVGAHGVDGSAARYSIHATWYSIHAPNTDTVYTPLDTVYTPSIGAHGGDGITEFADKAISQKRAIARLWWYHNA